MKSIAFVKQPAGALIALAILSLGAVGTYAATNWFNAHVGVKTDDTVISIDLSSCKNAFLPGFPDNQDMHNVQFKVTGQPHISEADLKKILLAQCENDAVAAFYHSNPATKDVDLHSAKVRAIDDRSLTLAYTFGGQEVSKKFMLTDATTFYNQGTSIKADGLQIGQSVIFVTPYHSGYMEGVDPLNDVSSVLSVFATQYDTMAAPSNGKYKFSYPDNNIMPLGMYNGLHKK